VGHQRPGTFVLHCELYDADIYIYIYSYLFIYISQTELLRYSRSRCQTTNSTYKHITCVNVVRNHNTNNCLAPCHEFVIACSHFRSGRVGNSSDLFFDMNQSTILHLGLGGQVSIPPCPAKHGLYAPPGILVERGWAQFGPKCYQKAQSQINLVKTCSRNDYDM